MRPFSYWAEFPATYRAEEVAQIAHWISVGESGAVAGIGASGRSNLLAYICARPDVLRANLRPSEPPLCCLYFDVNSLPILTTPYFYRGMIGALESQIGRWAEFQLPEQARQLEEEIRQLVQHPINHEDTFAIFDRLQRVQALVIERFGMTIVWFFNRFDKACINLDSQTLNSLRALRDQHKGRLCYMVAIGQPSERIQNRDEMDEFYEILAANTCWVGPMQARDATWVAMQMAQRLQLHFAAQDVEQMLAVSGGHPAFLRVVTVAFAEGEIATSQTVAEWVETLLTRPELVRICQEIWEALEPNEQQALSLLATGQPVERTARPIVKYLAQTGLVSRQQSENSLFCPLFAAFVGQRSRTSAGLIALHPQTRAVLRDGIPLDVVLTHQENLLLTYFLEHVDMVCSKDVLMNAIWPEDAMLQGVRDDRLAQLVKRLREKIEIDASNPAHVLTVRGRGYRFVQAGGAT